MKSYTEKQVRKMLLDALQVDTYEVSRYTFPDGTIRGIDNDEAGKWINQRIASENLKEQNSFPLIEIGDRVRILRKECDKIGDTINEIGDVGIVTSILNKDYKYRVFVKGRKETGNLSLRKNILLITKKSDIKKEVTINEEEE